MNQCRDDVIRLMNELIRAVNARPDRTSTAVTVAYHFIARTGLDGVVHAPFDDKVEDAKRFLAAAEGLLRDHYTETTGDEDAPF
jgi:hypothetical protein